MELRQIKYFIAVAEERNINRAAVKLHISQPPLTRQIQALEGQLGVSLFKRTYWGVELTQAGEVFYENAKQIQAHMDLAAELARKVETGQSGRLDVGVYGSAMLDIVPRILDAFSASHPDVNLVLNFAPKGPQIEALHRGRIVLAFDRYFPEMGDVCVEFVCDEALYVAVNTRNPLATESFLTLEQIAGEEMIGEIDSAIYGSMREAFDMKGLRLRISQRATDMITAAVMVAGGFGTALVPESVRRLQLPNITYVPLRADMEPRVALHCVYRKGDSNPLLAEMLKTIRSFMP